ncbi:hypothetical protein NDA01_03615 [Trichocoleus desertorum AS-A10]|uniref:STM4504/CBY_0614 family protein n=1 Tax=Trichocoleus desertorum TaxID=1481672 RepID=UPI0032992A3E
MYINLYSKRKKLAERSGQAEVYQYTDLPIEFRRQVVHIWLTAIGSYVHPERFSVSLSLVSQLWHKIHDSVARELGLFHLGSPLKDPFEQCQSFLLNKETPIDHCLDLIELAFHYIENIIPQLLGERRLNVEQRAEYAIRELNHRFREHGIGYQYHGGQIIRVDSNFIHAEAVVPALSLLSKQSFEGAEQEFRNAHEHYRKREYKDAIVDSLNAFESTMKIICDKSGWTYDKTATAKDLIKVVLQNGLVPNYLQTHLSGLRSVLESGVPTVRNKTSGHGQGSQPISVPEYLAAYALHLTASNIVLLVEAFEAKQGTSK